MTKKLYTIKELAAKWGMNPQTIYIWIYDGCPYILKWRGRQSVYHLDPEAVQEWLRKVRTKKEAKSGVGD